jgi:hypothetical protein
MGQIISRAFSVSVLAVMSIVVLGGCKPIVATCGDGFCDRPETSASCPSDCHSTVCGNAFCDPGETCASCAPDCGPCTGCNDGFCTASAGETCTTCPRDCGACLSCGDGSCLGSETCATCPGDCGSCGLSQPYQACTRDMDCAVSSDRCISVMRGGLTRAFCGRRNCTTDTDCDLDMHDAPGLCVSFSGGTEFDCFNRCNTTADCETGFTCGASDGVATHMVCLPGNTASVPPYRICSANSDCAGGLICESFTVSGVPPAHLCSRTGCSSDNDCPIDMRGGRGACLDFGAGMTACWERCNIRGDCANTTQFNCSQQVGTFTAPVMVCVPR